ncbi:hypothetical protein B2J93_9551 [Marssonina coronariae]|uniref:Uncharacterized protein n=1 Tax=Diplocarpon coronariae TaxID=2795749 RepID=A0A218Z8X6_9HELO|nr:hypothetical protein B2J93_9551 [Marssonina coronariae]
MNLAGLALTRAARFGLPGHDVRQQACVLPGVSVVEWWRVIRTSSLRPLLRVNTSIRNMPPHDEESLAFPSVSASGTPIPYSTSRQHGERDADTVPLGLGWWKQFVPSACPDAVQQLQERDERASCSLSPHSTAGELGGEHDRPPSNSSAVGPISWIHTKGRAAGRFASWS